MRYRFFVRNVELCLVDCDDGIYWVEKMFQYDKWRLISLALVTVMWVFFQLILCVLYRNFYLPFPTMYDGYVDDLLFCLG